MSWSLDEDGGEKPPAWAAAILAGALTDAGVLQFPSGIRAPLAAGLIPRRWREGAHFVFASARTAHEAHGLFDAPLFVWDFGGLRGFLSDHGAPLPRLAEAHLEAPLEALPAGVVGLVTSGVDGDLAGLATRGDARLLALRDALHARASALGVAWRET